MNWDAISAVAEAIGTAAVIVTLIYLASQIRQSNLQGQGNAHSAWIITWNETIKGWIRDRDTVEVMQRGFADMSALSQVEQAIFCHQVAAMINHWILAADLVDRVLLDDQLFGGATDVVVSVCSTTGGRAYLESNADAFPRGRQLLALVESGEGNLPPWNEVAPWWSFELPELGVCRPAAFGQKQPVGRPELNCPVLT